MTYALDPHDLSFVTEAPESYVFEARLRAEPERVFAAIAADPSTWTWFPGLKDGSYASEAPHGVGSIRQVSMGGTYYRETMLAWDEPRRWAYRVDESSAPIANAIVEDWVMEPDGDGTVLRWTFAVDPRAMFKAGRPTASTLMGSLFRKAMKNLDEQLGPPA